MYYSVLYGFKLWKWHVFVEYDKGARLLEAWRDSCGRFCIFIGPLCICFDKENRDA